MVKTVPMARLCKHCGKDCIGKSKNKELRKMKKSCSVCDASFINECEKTWRYWCTECENIWEDNGYEFRVQEIDKTIKSLEEERKEVFEAFRNYVAKKVYPKLDVVS